MANRTGELKKYVLDSYAILSLLGSEKGSGRVQSILKAAANRECRLSISLVNWGEVVYIVERERGLSSAREVIALIEEWPLEIENIDKNLTLTAAHIKAANALPYADCFAAALSIISDAILLTGDPEFKKLDNISGLKIEWLDA
jgi:predicted nucleic acid-binding protein